MGSCLRTYDRLFHQIGSENLIIKSVYRTKNRERARNPAFSQTGRLPDCIEKAGFLSSIIIFVLYTVINYKKETDYNGFRGAL